MAGTLTLTLPDDVIAKTNDHVRSGDITSPGDFVETEIDAWEPVIMIESERASRLEEIKAKIQRSLNEPLSPMPIDEVRERLKRLYPAHRSER